MTATSPGRSRLVRFLVRRSRRAVPVTPDSVSDVRPRRRVPMRMAWMVPRGPDRTNPTRSSDRSLTQRARHQASHDTPGDRPHVAARGPDRPVTSVTAVTGGASARRSTATVLADDLVDGLADARATGAPPAGGAQPDPAPTPEPVVPA